MTRFLLLPLLGLTSIPLMAQSPLRITTQSPLEDAVANGFYFASITATGGSSPYSWSIMSGTLPPGLSLTEDTPSAFISGQVDASASGIYNFTISVDCDCSGTGDSKAFSITVLPPVRI